MSNQVTICTSANTILAELLSGASQTKPNIMYVEFRQGSEPVDLPSIDPSDRTYIDPADDKYYLRLRENTLSSSDFLRIPIVSISRNAGANHSNTLLFNGICVGLKGVGGKSTLNSTIYGVALATSPTYGTAVDDITRDVVWARGYFEPKNQMPFSAVSQTLVTFKLNLTN